MYSSSWKEMFQLSREAVLGSLQGRTQVMHGMPQQEEKVHFLSLLHTGHMSSL